MTYILKNIININITIITYFTFFYRLFLLLVDINIAYYLLNYYLTYNL